MCACARMFKCVWGGVSVCVCTQLLVALAGLAHRVWCPLLNIDNLTENHHQRRSLLTVTQKDKRLLLNHAQAQTKKTLRKHKDDQHISPLSWLTRDTRASSPRAALASRHTFPHGTAAASDGTPGTPSEVTPPPSDPPRGIQHKPKS